MKTRLLPREEYPRLVGTEAELIWPLLPEQARVIVVEEHGEIIGTWTLLPIWHAECVWVRPDHRSRSSVARRLLAGMWQAAKSVGTRSVWTAAMSDDVKVIIGKLNGQPLPGEHFVLPMGE
jgi:hypothetical protein